MDNYTEQEVEQYTREVKDIVANYKSYGMIFKKKSHLKNFVEAVTSPFLSDPFYTFRTKLYWVVNDLKEFPRCKFCNKPLKWKNVDSVQRGYCDYCSNSCAQSSEEVLERKKANYRQLHGVDCWHQLPEAKEQLRQKWKNKTKEEIDERTRKSKATNKQRHGDENYNNIKQGLETNRRNHGGMLEVQTKEGKERRKTTCQDKYHTDYFSQSKEHHQKVRATWESKSDEEIKDIVDRRSITNNIKYGCDNPLQNEELKKMAFQKQIDEYGGIGFASDETRAKIQNRCMELYNTLDPGNRPEAIEQRRIIWEQKSPEEKEEMIKKCQESNKRNHGGILFQQTHEAHARRRKRIFHDGIWFDSKWEVKVYDFLKENKIEFNYQPEIVLPYECNGVKHFYQPDFSVCGRIVEVKGDNFFKIDEATGKEIMINPYRYPHWTDEQYENSCAVAEAKHQCMLNNNVIIIRGKDLNNLTEVFNYACSK